MMMHSPLKWRTDLFVFILQARKLDVFFEMEEKMITKSSFVSANVYILNNDI